MLKVTIQKGGYVKIGDAIVTVDKVSGSRVQLSIVAPKETKILRDKLAEREVSSDKE